jgi:hypothetical protein
MGNEGERDSRDIYREHEAQAERTTLPGGAISTRAMKVNGYLSPYLCPPEG